jgi:hypothetical protein
VACQVDRLATYEFVRGLITTIPGGSMESNRTEGADGQGRVLCFVRGN